MRLIKQIDLKSLLIGVLLSLIAVWVFAGTESQAQGAVRAAQMQVGDGGVYILRTDRTVVWKSKENCMRAPCY